MIWLFLLGIALRLGRLRPDVETQTIFQTIDQNFSESVLTWRVRIACWSGKLRICIIFVYICKTLMSLYIFHSKMWPFWELFVLETADASLAHGRKSWPCPRVMKCSIPEVDELLILWKEAAAWMTNFLKPFMHVNWLEMNYLISLFRRRKRILKCHDEGVLFNRYRSLLDGCR